MKVSLIDVYARSFVHSENSLLDLLTSSEQHLFRRTQVRQILQTLRQTDTSQYLIDLRLILFSANIRYHVKAAVCQWLSTVNDPCEQEFEIVSQFNDATGRFHQLFRNAALSTHMWFDLLNKKKWVQEQINSSNKERAEAVLWWLSSIAGEKPTEIAVLLRVWWGNDAKRASRLLGWFGSLRRRNPDDDLLQLCEDIINSHPANLFPDHGHDHIIMLLNTWGDRSPECCGRILHSLFEAWFALDPGRNLFERDELKAIDIHSLASIAAQAPEALLQGTTDALVRSIDMVVEEGESGVNWYDFVHRTYSGHRFGVDEFLGHLSVCP